MRFFETVLIFANIIAFCTLAIKQLRTIHWIGYAALAALLVAVIEVVVEGLPYNNL